MKIIKLNMASGHFFYSWSEIRQGENLASELEITLSPEFIGEYVYSIKFKLNSETVYFTETLTPVDGVITYPIKNPVTASAGILKLELNASDAVTGLLAKSAVANLKVIESIDGSGEIMPEAYVPWVTVINQAVLDATTQAGLAAGSAVEAARQARLAEGHATTAGIALGLKADKSETYTKTEVDTKNGLKADKTYTDTALLSKVDKVVGKGLSTEDYTTAEKTALNTTIPAQLADIGQKITLGKNLFNKDAVTNGVYVSQSNGTTMPNAIYSTSYFEAVVPNQQYCFTIDANVRIAFYDENQVFISGIYPVASPFTTPENAKYMRFSMNTTHVHLQQLEKGSQVTAYEPYGYKFSKPLPTQKDLACEIVLPPKIYALKGKELNIYFDNILNDKDTKYDFDVTCTIGNQLDNCFRVTPTSAGTYPITIKAYQDNIERAVATSSIIVTDTLVGNGVTKKLIVIGDSTTNSNWASIKINENFSTDVMNISTIGTRGTLPNKHEGRSGWKANFYVSLPSLSDVINAFWNPSTLKFDFGYYMLNSGVDVPDYVVINLGINDMFPFLDDVSVNATITTVLSEYQTMIDSIRAYSAAIKIGIAITIPPSYEQSAFGKNYKNGMTRWRYKRNNFLWIKALINNFKSKEAQGIYLVPINVNIDTRYNYGLESLPVNARNPKTVESVVANGGVHPDVPGYWQIADSFWYWLKSFEV